MNAPRASSAPARLDVQQALQRAVRTAAQTPGTTEHLLARLPAPIAVVGNGTPTHPWGAVLDRYPVVVRLDDYRTRGREALVGRRTDVWCTSGGIALAPRDAARVVSPFHAAAPASAHLAAFAARLGRPMTTAAVDVQTLLAEPPAPSTAWALACLLDALGLAADLFLVDGLGAPLATTNEGRRVSDARMQPLPHVSGRLAIHGAPEGAVRVPQPTLAANDADAAADTAARALLDSLGPRLSAPRVLVLGADAPLARALSAHGARTTTLAALGTATHDDGEFKLAQIETPVDLCVLVDLVGRLSDAALHVVLRHAHRLAPRVAAIRAAGEGAPPGWRDDVALGDAIVLSWRTDGGAAPLAVKHYELPVGYVERLRPEYYEDRDHGTIWQPDVYRLARDLARHLGSRRVVDIGCGQGRKLAALHPELAVVGLDQGENLARCRDAYPFGRWLDVDLECETPAPLEAADLAESVVVCADVIEHLQSPDRLLARLREMLRHAPCAVVTTPERALTHGAAHLGPPPNAAHVREWTLGELQRYVESAGLPVAFAGLTASETEGYRRQTSVLVLGGALVADASRDLARRAAAQLALYERERGTRRSAEPVSRAEPGPIPASCGVRLQPHDPATTQGVSIVMRTKDRPGLLERAIRSVRAQTSAEWQLLIVNDGGDPAAVHEAVRAAAAADARVTVVHHGASHGMEAATNAALAAATGTWVTVLDDDDTWEPRFLEVCLRHLRARLGSRVRGVVTHSTRVEEAAVGATMVERGRVPFTPSLRAVSLAELTQRNLFPVNAFVYERDALAVVGGYRADLPVLGDWEFNLRFLRHFDVDVVAEPLANYHQRPSAESGTLANSPTELHLRYEARLRNEWLRADLDRGVAGLGLLANLAVASAPLQHLLAERDAHVAMLAAVRLEDAALRAELSRLHQAVAEARSAEWRAVHVPLAQRAVARLRRRHADAAVVLVGAGALADLLADEIGAAPRVVAIGDNNARKWGTAWRDLRIAPVAEALAVEAEVVMIASLAHRQPLAHQVRRELGRLGRSRRVETLLAR